MNPSICSGCVNPASPEDALEQHELVLKLIPYMLSVSPLDCEAARFHGRLRLQLSRESR
ncbi:MAG: hypothetical protein R3C12_12760 [Planctomycetaceae bacterium]